MINQTGLVGISGMAAASVGVKEADTALGFEELLTEKTVGELVDKENFTEEVMENILKSIASMSEGSKNIWEIVLRLEESAVSELSDENIITDFDNTAGLNSIAGLLARYWKKKELLGESDTVLSRSQGQSEIDDRAASELAALLKKKEHKLIEEVHE